MSRRTCYLDPLIPFQEIKTPINWHEYFDCTLPLNVEIGFGMGEFLVGTAREHSDTNYIGIEKNWERIQKTLKKIDLLEKEAVAQGKRAAKIRILKLDATVVFGRLLEKKSIDHVYCLFPCPWPKKEHTKFRLFSKNFLRLINSCLKPRGEITIVTDFLPYFEWICRNIKGTGFTTTTSTIAPTYGTKFERKWGEEGQEEFFKIELKKKKHIFVEMPGDIEMKSYKLSKFDPNNFHFSDQTGECSIIFKDMFFDPVRQQAIVHLIVAEPSMTQHIRVMITKKNSYWCICKTGGQIFFPTPGIAEALRLVYDAAKQTAKQSQ